MNKLSELSLKSSFQSESLLECQTLHEVKCRYFGSGRVMLSSCSHSKCALGFKSVCCHANKVLGLCLFPGYAAQKLLESQ